MLENKESGPCSDSIELDHGQGGVRITGMPSSPSLFRPRTLDEALDILAGTPDARPISGGASLVAMMNAGLVEPAALVSLTRIPELSGIRRAADGGIMVGAATRHSAIAADRVFDGTARCWPMPPPRSPAPRCATWAPSAARSRTPTPASIFRRRCSLSMPTCNSPSKSGRRALPIRDFFVDWYTTALEPGEIVIGFEIPKPKPGVGFYLKHARVAGDFAIVSIALSLADDGEVRVAVGGCGPAAAWLDASRPNAVVRPVRRDRASRRRAFDGAGKPGRRRARHCRISEASDPAHARARRARDYVGKESGGMSAANTPSH